MRTKSYVDRRPSIEEAADPKIVQAIRDMAPLSVDVLGETLAFHMIDVAYVHTRYGNFKPLRQIPFGGLFYLALSEHREQKDKNQRGFIYADICDYRKNKCVKKIWAIVIDIDGTASLVEVRKRATRAGHGLVLHTTFNHGRIRQRIEGKHFAALLAARKAFPSAPLSDEELRDYCCGTIKYSTLKNVRVLNGGQVCDAANNPHYEIAHDPEEKLRIIILLDEPINLEEVGQDGATAIYEAIAREILGDIAYDKSCKNAARVHWAPAKPIGLGEGHVVDVVQGPLMSWRTQWERLKSKIEHRRAETITRAKARRQLRELHCVDEAISEISECLECIPASVEYPKWFSVLAAIHNETEGSQEGLALAHEWSARAPADYDEDELNAIWDYLDRGGNNGRRAGMGTLVMLSRQNRPDFRAPHGAEEFDVDLFGF